MLNKRQEKIIMLLEDSKKWITGKEISRLMNVSDRTIRSDIDAINRFYNETLIESNLRSGYHINQEVLASLPIELHMMIPQTPQERCVYVIQELLFEKKELNLLDLQEQVFISGYSIENDIKKIKKMLEPYENLELVRSKNYIRLEGSEKSKRELYKMLLSKETQGNFLNLNKLSSMFQEFNLLQVKEIMEEVLNKYNCHVRQMVMPMLMIHIGIALERMLHQNYIETSRGSEALKERKEYLVAQEFFERMARKIRIQVVENEVILLALLLMGKRAVSLQSDLVSEHVKTMNTQELIQKIMDVIRQDFDIDFSNDHDLCNGLSTHLQGLIERRNKDIIVSNIYLQELKRKYPLVFELAIHVGELLKDVLKMDFSENEIGFLALHLGAAYERMGMHTKYRAVMIHPIDQALSNMCLKKVETLFSQRMDVIECVGFFEEHAILELKPDLILTTLQLKHHLDIPTIPISLFLNTEDESRIFQALNDLDKKRFRKEFEDGLIRLVEKDTFHYDLDLQTPTEVITYMCNHLCQLGYCDETFTASVLQRESVAATSFVYSFAVPHSLNVPSKKPAISIAFLKKPIQWGEFEVKMVMLLAIHEGQQEILKMFFTWLSNMINDANHFAGLLETKSYEDFISKIVE